MAGTPGQDWRAIMVNEADGKPRNASAGGGWLKAAAVISRLGAESQGR